jgi:hypothetical protein
MFVWSLLGGASAENCREFKGLCGQLVAQWRDAMPA